MHGFRSYFTPVPRFFSPFPHGTGSLSVIREYLALEGGPPGFTWDSTCPMLLRKQGQRAKSVFAYGAITLCRHPFQRCLANRLVCNSPRTPMGPQPRSCNTVSATPSGLTQKRFGLFRVRSPLLTESLRFLFHRVLRCFNSPGWLYPAYVFSGE